MSTFFPAPSPAAGGGSEEAAGAPSAGVDTGLLGLAMLARFHGLAADPDQLAHDFREPGKPFGADQILLAAKSLGLKAKAVRTEWTRLERTPLPALAADKDGRFFILARFDGDRVLIQDPRIERPQILAQADFSARWSGTLILFTSRASLTGELARFDFTWFIPAVVKYRKLLGEVFAVSFVLQLFALVTPLFFQVVMDKVLVHRGFTTLDVVAFGLLVVMIFEVMLSGLRSYVFAHTTSRIDVELGTRLFRHLINLPLAYFQARRVGDTVARVRELEHIRQFLTGNALTLVLDLFFSVVFIAVMLFYSGWLTLVVVLSLPCYLILSVLITPLLRARLHEKFNRGAENQAFLVETINGIDTLKAMAVEPQMARRWDNQQAAYVAAGFRIPHPRKESQSAQYGDNFSTHRNASAHRRRTDRCFYVHPDDFFGSRHRPGLPVTPCMIHLTSWGGGRIFFAAASIVDVPERMDLIVVNPKAHPGTAGKAPGP